MMLHKIYLLIVLFSLSGFVYSESESEKQVRAMFVYNFANFVEWPKKAFRNNTSPLQVCLLGEVSFADYLTPMSGTIIGERELVVTTQISTKFKGKCHILFVGNEKKVDMRRLYKSKRFIYILSVSEQKGFIESGGMIKILDQSKRISFDIDLDNARKRGLFISSDLISLARNIKRLSE